MPRSTGWGAEVAWLLGMMLVAQSIWNDLWARAFRWRLADPDWHHDRAQESLRRGQVLARALCGTLRLEDRAFLREWFTKEAVAAGTHLRQERALRRLRARR